MVSEAVSVAYAGRDGAHAATACERLFPHEASVIPLPSFTAVVEATVAGEVQFGVLPIESSLSGSIAETHDLLHASPLSITHETVLRFLPPYIVEKKHIDEVIAALDSALETKSGSKAPRVKVPAAPLRAVHKRKARRSHA